VIKIGGLVALLSAVWCLAGGVFLIINGAPDSDSPGWHSALASGLAVGSVCFIIGGVVAGFGDHRDEQRRWRTDLHDGTATLTDLRPGEVNGDRGTQDLLCRLEVTAPGRATLEGEYRAAVGPLDALKVVEGASFPCQVSPSFPERVRVHLTAERHLEFTRRRPPTVT
jgi:hypothetical protein